MVEQWNSDRGTVEQIWWNSGTVEQIWWNSATVIVELRNSYGGTEEQLW